VLQTVWTILPIVSAFKWCIQTANVLSNPQTQKRWGKTLTMSQYFLTAHSCNLRYEWNHRNSFYHCEDFSWATRRKGQHISTRIRLKKRSRTPTTVSYFKAKVLTSTTRIVSFEAKKAVQHFQSPPFTIYGFL